MEKWKSKRSSTSCCIIGRVNEISRGHLNGVLLGASTGMSLRRGNYYGLASCSIIIGRNPGAFLDLQFVDGKRL